MLQCRFETTFYDTVLLVWCGCSWFSRDLAEARNFYVLCTIIYVDSFFIRYIYYILSPFCTVLKKMESLQDLSLSALSKNIGQYDLPELCDIRLFAKNSGVINKGKLKAWDRRILDIFDEVRHA